MNSVSYIVGSGPSLLSLNDEEVLKINESKFILSFNKHLIFYEDIGIVPTHYLLADSHDKAVYTFWEVVAKLNDKNLSKLHIILSNQLLNKLNNLYGQEKVLEALASHPVTTIDRNHWLKGGRWAHSLDEPIFHFRGTLSGCINIASIHQANCDIVLLGVDLHDHSYFFNSHLLSNPARWAPFLQSVLPHQLVGSVGNETMVPIRGVPGIDYAMPFMRRCVEANGGRLFSGNKESVLCERSILDYFPILEKKISFSNNA